MTILYSVEFEDSSSHRGGEVWFSSETKARARARVLLDRTGQKVVGKKWVIPDKRDLDWLCRVFSTEHPDDGSSLAGVNQHSVEVIFELPP